MSISSQDILTGSLYIWKKNTKKTKNFIESVIGIGSASTYTVLIANKFDLIIVPKTAGTAGAVTVAIKKTSRSYIKINKTIQKKSRFFESTNKVFGKMYLCMEKNLEANRKNQAVFWKITILCNENFKNKTVNSLSTFV